VDFHKVSESESALVFQDMQKYKTKEPVLEDGTKLPAPTKYGPAKTEFSPDHLKAVLKEFDGYDITAISFSIDNGTTVTVARPKDDEYVEPEPGVVRLQAAGKKVKTK